MVGRAIATRLAGLGHAVTMGSRTPDNEQARQWAEAAGNGAGSGTFADAAAHGEIVFNCTAGLVSLDALAAAGADNLDGKVLIDVANPLDFSRGLPPALAITDTSLGEQIQNRFPGARVVKALNTMNCEVMVEPSTVPGSHVVFICGNADSAKREVRSLLSSFGWPDDSILDLGDISAARGTEMFLPLWLLLYGSLGTGRFNVAVVR
jgi:predicted dinucleotide-binding enzyme